MSMNWRIGIVAALFLAARFAPALPALHEHDEVSTHCNDGIPYEHFEPHADHPEHEDCQTCIQSASGGMVLDAPVPLSIRSGNEIRNHPPALFSAGPTVVLACTRAPPALAA